MHIQWTEFTLPIEKVTVTWMGVTLTKRGHLTINRAAYRALGQPERVVLLFDVQNSLIGLRPAGSNIKNALPLKRRRDSRESYRVCAKNFCNYYQIGIRRALKFNDIKSQDDGTLILDLRTVTESRRSLRPPEL